MKLLIINDEVITAKAMKKEIAWGIYGITDVSLAFDAEEAKVQIQEHEIDIMLCDIEMPGENGIELLRWVRQQELDIDCIYLTCHANFAYAQEAVKLGCMDYVLMPARYEMVAEAVEKVVNRRKQSKEQEQLQKYGQQWVQEKKERAVKEQGVKKSQKQIVQECTDYILAHLEEELSVNAVAANSYLNPVYLNRLFKEEHKISISQYIIREKMELAARLLKSGELNAQVVAERVGYPNYPYFSSTFKKHFGCSPKQYVEQEKKE